MRVVDGHLHLWDPDVLTYEWLEGRLLRSFGPDDLDLALQDAPEADCGFVFVQADCAPDQSIAEADWVASLASRVPVRGIVAHAPMEDPAATEAHLAAFAERPLVVGVRRLLQSEPEGFCLRPGFLRSAQALAAAGLSFDACVRWEQLPDVVALADALPDLGIVLDHLGKPEVGTPEVADPADGTPWAESLRDLARRPNVVCKVSGLPAESPGEWTDAQLRPFLDVALDAFGPERLLFGSDWPVSVPFGRWLATVSDWLADRVGEHHQRAVLAENAEAVYRLR
ncbi:amidohydrolase family protein [Microbacterium sp. M3]|uniref:Amidohydrolase family protein n=1 Tax=Microbacterium arthrosphaerae TaxID=792652 RepID=A0ABU4GYK9_9MICO|nr:MULTISPECIES: amidohydrolase family protein [Microbacterium]MDW4572162.1 amidohydrolase family protein [Microbacterium arthrosphaerae]MDW7606017.1 amidohydrolase family protein [Microbacterium sp. M3]